MTVLRTSLAALALVCAAYCSQPPVSARDQYIAHEDWPHPPQLFNEATDRPFKIPKSHRFNLTPKKPIKDEYEKNDIVPDLQVGCGEGFVETSTVSNRKTKNHEKLFKLRRKRYADLTARRHRSLFNLQGRVIHTPSSISYTIWKAPNYQVVRPYYIPVLGGSGRFPIYFPAQPVFINPGFPLHNPPAKPGLAYLPPATSTSSPTQDTTMALPSRFDQDDVDDRPYWGAPAAPATTKRTPSKVIPTRRPARPDQKTTHPPLFHSGAPEEIPNALALESDDKIFANIFQTSTTTTARPTTNAAPSRCVWAIISCCSANSGDLNENCFEQLGCSGAFWGASPCDSEFARAAIASALNYYKPK